MRNKRRLPLVAFVLLFLAPLAARAAEPAPGDACSTAGSVMRTGGPETSGVGHTLICQGGTWKSAFGFNASAQVTKIGNLTCSANDVLKFDGTKWTCSAPTMGADTILESMLKAVNAPTDEYCLTYETTTGDFEWQTCGAGGDNLGNHTATTNINLGANYISRAGTAAGLSFDASNNATLSANLTVTGDVLIDSGAANTGTDSYVLRFGSAISGEAIGSKRSVGGNFSGLDFYTAHTNRMVVSNGGNVGIGTTSPGQKLEVNGTALASTLSSSGDVNAAGNFLVDSGAANTGTNSYVLRFGSGISGEALGSKRSAGGNQNGLDFYTASTNRMAITNSGNVGIGTTGAQSLLHVANTGYAQFEKTFAGAPTGTDCDAAAELGRVTVDTTNGRWYVCTGTGGWKYTTIGTSGGAGDNLGNHTASANITLGAYSISRTGSSGGAGLSFDTSDNAVLSGDLTVTGNDIVMGTNTAAMLLIADGTNFSPTALTGDVTIDNALASKIGDNKILEAMLKAVDAPTDEECLTYETTTGDFEWQACGGGGPTIYNAGSSTTINWANGTQQYTTANCGAFTFSNMVDGGNYTLSVRGSTSGTCSFSHTGLTFRMPPGHTSSLASTYTLYAFARMGTVVHVSWMRGV
jgi:hypothetical protein